jgi:hypothetical protein
VLRSEAARGFLIPRSTANADRYWWRELQISPLRYVLSKMIPSAAMAGQVPRPYVRLEARALEPLFIASSGPRAHPHFGPDDKGKGGACVSCRWLSENTAAISTTIRGFPVESSVPYASYAFLHGKSHTSPPVVENQGTLRAVSQLLWPDKDREVWFSLGENHEKACRFPDFLQRGTR